MKTKFKRLLVILLSLAITFTIAPNTAMAETKGRSPIYYEGTWDYEKAYEIFELTNAKRAEHELPPLELDTSLMEKAMSRSQEAAILYSHDSMNLEDIRYEENLAAGTAEVGIDGVFQSWVNSPEDFDNMTSKDYKSMGVGVFTQDNFNFYYIQVFSFDKAKVIDDQTSKNKRKLYFANAFPEYLKLSFMGKTSETIYMLTGDTLASDIRTPTYDSKGNSYWNEEIILNPYTFLLKSEDDSVVRWNEETGKIEAVGPGDAAITVQLANYTDQDGYMTKKFHVDIPAESITIDHQKPDLRVGESQQLNAKAVPNNATYTWVSSDSNIVSVDKAGKITAHKPGIATITVSGRNENGIVSDTCRVSVYQDVSVLEVIGIEDKTYHPAVGAYIQDANKIIVKDGEEQVSPSYYEISYRNNTGIGEAAIILTGKENYRGSMEKIFQILPLSLMDSNISVNGIQDMPYTGDAVTLPIELMYDSTPLVEGTDYDVRYSDNTNQGVAKVEIKGKGNYKDTITKHFSIIKEEGDCNHESTKWSVVKEATCIKEGNMEEYCTVCGQLLNTEKIPATGHEGTWEVTKEATCLEPGERKETCIKCKEVLNTEVIPVLGGGIMKSGLQQKKPHVQRLGIKKKDVAFVKRYLRQ